MLDGCSAGQILKTMKPDVMLLRIAPGFYKALLICLTI
jgi:hypothetical protein